MTSAPMSRDRPRPHRPHTTQPVHPHETREPGEVLYGLRAGLAVFDARRDDILRVAYAAPVRARLGHLLQWASTRRIACAEMPDGALARLAGTTNHEGLCLSVRPRRWLSPSQLGDMLEQRKGCAIALDRVRNPYNIGAILRTAAFFGVDAALLGAMAPHPALPPDAARVAEGGAEHIPLARTTDLADTLGRLRARGIRIIGGENDAAVDAKGYAFTRPAVLVLGHEREGLSPQVRAQCDAMIAIRGAGAIDSLNVAIAGSLLIAELVR